MQLTVNTITHDLVLIVYFFFWRDGEGLMSEKILCMISLKVSYVQLSAGSHGLHANPGYRRTLTGDSLGPLSPIVLSVFFYNSCWISSQFFKFNSYSSCAWSKTLRWIGTNSHTLMMCSKEAIETKAYKFFKYIRN